MAFLYGFKISDEIEYNDKVSRRLPGRSAQAPVWAALQSSEEKKWQSSGVTNWKLKLFEIE